MFAQFRNRQLAPPTNAVPLSTSPILLLLSASTSQMLLDVHILRAFWSSGLVLQIEPDQNNDNDNDNES